jgi:hypothetical protein
VDHEPGSVTVYLYAERTADVLSGEGELSHALDLLILGGAGVPVEPIAAEMKEGHPGWELSEHGFAAIVNNEMGWH